MANDRIVVWDRATKRTVPLITGIDPIGDSKASPWPGIKLEHFRVENLRTPEGSTSSFLAALCLSADPDATFGSPGDHLAIGAEETLVVAPGEIPSQESTGHIEFLLLEVAPTYLVWAAEEIGAGDHFNFGQYWRFQDEQLRHILLAMHHELLAGFPSGRLFGEYMGLSFATTLLSKRLPTTRTAGYRGGLSPVETSIGKSLCKRKSCEQPELDRHRQPGADGPLPLCPGVQGIYWPVAAPICLAPSN